jgi:hypothetical protein
MNELHDIGWAVRQMRESQKVRRRGWKWGTFIVLMPEPQLPPYSMQGAEQNVNYRTAKFIGEDEPLNCRPYIAAITRAGNGSRAGFVRRKTWSPPIGRSPANERPAEVSSSITD